MNSEFNGQYLNDHSLKLSLVGAILLGVLVLCSIFSHYGSYEGLYASLFYAFYLSGWCWANLHFHVGTQGPIKSLGGGFWVTWMRGLAVAFLFGAVSCFATFEGEPFIFFGAYGLVAIGDALDGAAARWTQTVSAMGARLENQVDAMGMLVASIAAIFIETLPPYYLLLSLVYFLFHFGMWFRERMGREVFRDRMMQSLHNRYFAGVHMCLLTVALYPGAASEILSIIASFGLFLLLLCFVRDWLYVSGVVQPGDARANLGWSRTSRFARHYGSVGARVFIGVILALGLYSSLPWWLSALCLLTALGLFARTLAWLCLAYLVLGNTPLVSMEIFLLTGALTWVAWLGSGLWSIMKQDDALYFRTMGVNKL
ncbi:MAG: CDP-alcohol phosphatidyltransferase family protein [Deltaproteobacteria bacterium]|jgi:CDP-diacylglycerol---glycerol-3-phosphate 3-phosphatidyltransferase|nr:CDP-alcohol phosphatidyltransferase family protein [Deltaproteobacteria bacterium]MBT6433025.1 CDP-alcohol phosphatidyltransferase family protein [Deltaproteobacteria bacterium]MBT6488714.1 CDP-alcohol phosphatidyltransferase family protein [Deltaproteobacteria bacterium]